MISINEFKKLFSLRSFNCSENLKITPEKYNKDNLKIIRNMFDYIKSGIENEDYIEILEHIYRCYEPDENGIITYFNDNHANLTVEKIYELHSLIVKLENTFYFENEVDKELYNYNNYYLSNTEMEYERKKETEKALIKVYPYLMKAAFNYGVESSKSTDKCLINLYCIYNLTVIISVLVYAPKFWPSVFINIEDACEKRAENLLTKKQSLVKYNSDSSIDDTAWINEKRTFSDILLLVELGIDKPHLFGYILKTLYLDGIIEKAIENYNSIKDINYKRSEKRSNYKKGIDYEEECKNILKLYDWDIISTPATNDKGVDIIASKHGLKVAFQCKNWKSRVGTASIQEIFTGKEIYNSDFGVVLSESGFTNQAKVIAENLNIFLIDKNKIQSLEVLIINKLRLNN